MSGVFVSYRREDAEAYAGRLCDRLRERFGPEAVFMDVDAIAPGADWVAAVEGAVGSCPALVALIGPRWLRASTPTGGRRLDDPRDVVAAEIAAALRREILVVPVLVGGARMPAESDLPTVLAPLARRQALELSHARWEQDVARLVEVLGAVVPALEKPTAAPPPRHNLPAALTSFIGREQELAEITKLFAGARLVTLVGAGGCGKTRLALEGAGKVVDDYPDGAWLVELAPLTDPVLVPSTVASALGVREEPGRTLPATLGDFLSGRDLLLVLDNCEHLVDAAAALSDALLRAASRLSILATSREPLGVSGEVTFRVPSLPTPDAGGVGSSEGLLAFDAVRLFVERAQAASAFALTPANAAAVAEICSRLDGIPLALELAAARTRALAPAEIAARLDHRFRLLRGGARTAPSRQQTLEAAIGWSHDLLTEPERICLRRLAVFAGGFTLEAAEVVCGDDVLDVLDVLDLLATLVEKSLVVTEEAAGATRYRMLETIRAYGTERLGDAGEAEVTRGRHLGYFTALAKRAEPELEGPDQAAWLERLEDERDNLRAGLLWAIASRPGEAAQGLAAALWRYWYVRGHWSEGRELLAAALAGAAQPPPPARAGALRGLGGLALAEGDYPEARSLYGEALALYREQGDRQGMARTLNNLGIVADNQGDYPEARSVYEEALALYREQGDRQGMARTLNNLGVVGFEQGDYPGARSVYEEALAIYRELGHRQGVANTLDNLGNVAQEQGDHPGARSLFEEALVIFRELGDRWGVANTLHNLGNMAVEQGDYPASRSLFEEALALRREMGDRRGCGQSLEGLARLAAAQGYNRRGARLLGAAAALRDAMGAPVPPSERARRHETLAALRAGLGDDALGEALAEGRTISLEDALAYAASDDD